MLHAINAHTQHGGKDPYSVLHISFMLLLATPAEKNPKYPTAVILHGPQSCSVETSRNICLCWEVNLVQQT